jgi:hypothetical protein
VAAAEDAARHRHLRHHRHLRRQDTIEEKTADFVATEITAEMVGETMVMTTRTTSTDKTNGTIVGGRRPRGQQNQSSGD